MRNGRGIFPTLPETKRCPKQTPIVSQSKTIPPYPPFKTLYKLTKAPIFTIERPRIIKGDQPPGHTGSILISCYGPHVSVNHGYP